MTRKSVILVAGAFVLATGLSAESYRLENVRWVEQDIYRAQSGENRGTVVVTKNCHHRGSGEDAVLMLTYRNRQSPDDKIVWEGDDEPCRVISVTKP
jgi:hypothetical protein